MRTSLRNLRPARCARFAVCSFAMLGALLLAAGEARAAPWHGGCAIPPKFVPAKASGKPGGASKPSAPGATTGAGAAPGKSGTGGPGQARPGKPGGGSYGPQVSLGIAPDSWEQWWHDNQDRFLDLRSHLADEVRSSGAPFPLTGRGRLAVEDRRASDEAVTRDILPVLFEQLATSDEPEILDSALIALGRCVPDAEAERLLLAARPLLAHDVLSVQTAAVLALGIQGSPSYVPLLAHLMADTSAGRAAVGGGSVPAPVRSIAALSLGLGNHEAGVPMLADLVQHLPDAERDLKVCAVTALGLARNAAGDEALRVLLGLLGERRLDSLIKAHVPIAIARLDDGTHTEAVPALLACFEQADTDDAVRTSCAMALGRLASLDDLRSLQALSKAAADATDERTRHAALIALAEMGLRDLPDEERHAGLHGPLAGLFSDALAGSAAHADRAWAALAAGLYASGGASRAPQLVERMIWSYRQHRDPSLRGAFALALGLAGATEAAPEIAQDFLDHGDESLRGHAAVALGLLGARDALDPMLRCCTDKSVDPVLREQAAVGLALLGATEVVPSLIDVLGRVEVHPVSLSVARALGRIGDREAIGPLVHMARDAGRQPGTRGFACVGLGLLGERGALPWNASLKEMRRDEARVASLDLVLDIL